MLISVERTQKEFAESDQAFLITLLAQLRTKLVGMFDKYVEEQFKFIEEARNKTKRKGVLPFMRIFPVSVIHSKFSTFAFFYYVSVYSLSRY